MRARLISRRDATVAEFRAKLQAPDTCIDIPSDAVIYVSGVGCYNGFYREYSEAVDRGWDCSSPAGRFGTEYGYEMCHGAARLRYDDDQGAYRPWGSWGVGATGWSDSSLLIVKRRESVSYTHLTLPTILLV